MRAVCFLSLQTSPNCAQPILVRVFFVRYQLNSCCAMEVNHRANYRIDVAKHMDEASMRKKLSQAADVQRILRRSYDPQSLRPGGNGCGFEPLLVNVWRAIAVFTIDFDMSAMPHYPLVNASGQ